MLQAAGIAQAIVCNAGAFGSGASGAAAAYRRMLDSPWARTLQSGVASRPGFAPTPADAAAMPRSTQPPADCNASAHDTRSAAVADVQGIPADAQKRRQPSAHAEPRFSSRDDAMLQQMAALACTDAESLRKAAVAYPALLGMSADKVAGRLLKLKRILPGALHALDVAGLAAHAPLRKRLLKWSLASNSRSADGAAQV